MSWFPLGPLVLSCKFIVAHIFTLPLFAFPSPPPLLLAGRSTNSVKMLRKDKNRGQDWMERLPQMAKQLEVSLYKTAQSFEEYMNMSTLKQRLQMIAIDVSRKSRGDGRSSSSSRSDRSRSGDRTSGGSNNMATNNTNANNNNGGSNNNDSNGNNGNNPMFPPNGMPPQQNMMRQTSQNANQPPFMNMNQGSSHPMMQPSQQQQPQQMSMGRQSDMNAMMGVNNNGMAGMGNNNNNNNNMMNQPNNPNNNTGNAFMGSGSGSSRSNNNNNNNNTSSTSTSNNTGSSNSGSGRMSNVTGSSTGRTSSSNGQSSSSSSSSSSVFNRTDREWKIRIRHKQQRLLLLHHSAKCTKTGPCDVTPHCADMKRLWRHMEACRDNNCQVPHCFSSRAILSHYRKCKDQNCPACSPVRQTVRNSQKGGSSSSSRNLGGSSSSSSSRHGSSTGPNKSSVPGTAGSTSSGTTSNNNNEGNNNNNNMMNNGMGGMMMNQPQSQMMGNNGGMMMNQQGGFGGMGNNGNANMNNGGMSNSFPPTQMQVSSSNSSTSSRSNMPPPTSGPSPGGTMPFTQSSNPGFMSNQPNNMQSSNGNNSAMMPPMMPPQQGSNGTVMPMGGRNNTVSSSLPIISSTTTSSASTSVQSGSGAMGNQTGSSAIGTSGTGSGGGSGGGSGNSRNRNSNEWQKVRHKQQRLLLLRHASKCQHPPGKCPVTPHCGNMKKLWSHIARCKDQDCKVQHCMSSRYVLSHFRRCKDPRCPACGPVRETIRNSHAKEKNRTQSSGGGNGLMMPGFDLPTTGSNDIVSSSGPTPGTVASSSSSSPPAPDATLMPKRKKSKTGHNTPSPSVTPVSTTSSPSAAAAAAGTVPSSSASSSGGKGDSASPMVCKPISAPAKAMPGSQGKTGKVAGKTEDHSLLNSFTVKEIETHLASLHRALQLPPAKLKAKCSEVLKALMTHEHGWVFNNPVDPVELGLPDYFDVIKKPMDLGTISRRIDTGLYHSIEDFVADVRLTFDNATRYNETGSVVYDFAVELKTKFVEEHKEMMQQLEKEDREARKNDRACTLCGCEKLMFEPPVFFCNGMNCPSKRIRRNSHFYIGGNNQYFWCNQCYNELKDSVPIDLVDTTIMKADLNKKKNDEVHEESWVQCDECESWIHQICGLFNTRQNKEHHSKYFCPKCMLKKRKEGVKPTPRPLSAEDLPRTKLSEVLEKHVMKKVNDRKHRMAKEKVEAEKIPYEDALASLHDGGPITIRQVTATDRKLDVREYMKKRYAHKNYPDEFPFRCKCIVVFQRMDGVDVILFALYVYEHGEDNPEPNKRTVYVSYLDSVHFMRPRKLRTFVYHELLIAYLDYARKKGFATAHIWACPPLKGDDYIFYAKPEDQKTPRDARLRQWYIDMLIECQKRSICGKLTNMYDLYFANESLDATSLPYFEGDYFPGEAENIIKDLNEGLGRKGLSGGKKSKKKSNKKGRNGRMDDDDLAASGLLGGPKRFEDGGRDEVMVKLGEIIHPMKDSFIVAFLNWSGAKKENLTVPESIAQYRRENPQANVDKGNKKRDRGGELKDDSGRPIKVLDDDKEDMDCEFLNNRQAFLNLCRGNHYQFDELRRAKHTSMMVLWHLHNRDAPKFVQQCAACSREILTGTRYHCNVCPEYDLCEECHRNPKTNRGACTHKLVPLAVESADNQDGNGSSGNGLTEAQRRERQRNLELHIQLIEHVSTCKGCNSSNCAKMKSYMQHARTCKVKAGGGCRICKRIWTLLRIHAQKCKDTVCSIPQCMAIRERIRQLAKQQQAMDDRRRQEMNRAYRMNNAQSG